MGKRGWRAYTGQRAKQGLVRRGIIKLASRLSHLATAARRVIGRRRRVPHFGLVGSALNRAMRLGCT